MLTRILLLLVLSVSLDVSAADTDDAQSATPDASAADSRDAQDAAPGASAPDATDSRNATPVKPVPIDEDANDKATCAAKWDRYYKSQECFAPYHNVNGTMKPGAFEHCKEVLAPIECSLP